MGLAGGSLVSFAFFQRRSYPLSAAAGALGLLALSRSVTNIEAKRLLGFGGRRAIQFRKTVHILAPVEEVYRFWSSFENFPGFMSEVVEVRPTGEKRSRWTVRGPAGVPIHFDSELTLQEPNRALAWKNIAGSIRHAGRARFFPTEEGGTKIELDFCYNPPAGFLGHELARAFGADPKRRLEESLAQLKQLIEQGPSRRQASAMIKS